MTVVPIRPLKADPTQEVHSAWHIYKALATYRAANPELEGDVFYNEFMAQAHKHWADLFGVLQ